MTNEIIENYNQTIELYCQNTYLKITNKISDMEKQLDEIKETKEKREYDVNKEIKFLQEKIGYILKIKNNIILQGTSDFALPQ